MSDVVSYSAAAGISVLLGYDVHLVLLALESTSPVQSPLWPLANGDESIWARFLLSSNTTVLRTCGAPPPPGLRSPRLQGENLLTVRGLYPLAIS